VGLLSGEEFRLLFAALLNALVLWASWRFAKRMNDDKLDAAGDTLLLYYLVQYLSVGIPGAVRALHPLTIGAVALVCSGIIGLAGSWKRRPRPQFTPTPIPPRLIMISLATGAFALAYAIALAWHQRFLPVLSNDAITYHLPAAVQWLQTGRLGMYEAWFYNPANSYSPLAGSTFIAWLIAPMGGDVFARFVQFGPWVMLFIVTMNVCRRLGADVAIAALVAAALMLSRPFASQTILAKDDLFAAAFFVLAIDAFHHERLARRFGPWRLGIAGGLLLATKFTVLLSLPIFILMLHRGWTWRRLSIAAACATLLAGPWYLRNIRLTGNPLYPTDFGPFRGMLHVTRSALLATPRGVWDVFTNGYYGMPPALAIVLIVALVVAIVMSARSLSRDPLLRTCVIGPIVGIWIFVAVAPYGEMRFALPSIALLFAAVSIPFSRHKVSGFELARYGIGALIVVLAALTGFIIQKTILFAGAGAIGAIIAALTYHFRRIALIRIGMPIGALTAAAMAMMTFMYSYTRLPRDEAIYPWQQQYGSIADAWDFVRHDLPLGANIAYANTFFAYPLMGAAYDHRVTYVPTRANLERFIDMPRIEKKITGEQIVANVCAMLRDNPNRTQWLRRLRYSHAAYLFVAKQDPAAPEQTITPPELPLIDNDPMFTRVFENDAAIVFRINK
jgi:hypothetical protein